MRALHDSSGRDTLRLVITSRVGPPVLSPITPIEKALGDPARVARRIEHEVRKDRKVWPKCGGQHFASFGDGLMTGLHELVPTIVERQLHVQEKLRRRCGETILTADGPTKVFDKARVGKVALMRSGSTDGDSVSRHQEGRC